MSLNLIRNFSIIAHIDHGKSSLAASFLKASRDLTEALNERTQQGMFLCL